MNEVIKTKRPVISNKEKILKTVNKYPGLRFHQIKNQTKIANGTMQHHLDQLVKSNAIHVNYIKKIPRYYSESIEKDTQIILLRMRQNTTSKIIKSLLKNECQTFSQLVKFAKKSPGTVSVYKNQLLRDNIIVGNTDQCECNKDISTNKIKYRLVDEDKVRSLVAEYGKSSLQESADNLADVFLSIK